MSFIITFPLPPTWLPDYSRRSKNVCGGKEGNTEEKVKVVFMSQIMLIISRTVVCT